jgi:hypothetical protein
MTIVRNTYRYKRPPRKRKAKTAEIEVPAIVTFPREKLRRAAKPAPGEALRIDADLQSAKTHHPERKSAIVTIRRKPSSRFGDVPDLTPEELQQRGDAADELFQRFKREIAGKLREG